MDTYWKLSVLLKGRFQFSLVWYRTEKLMSRLVYDRNQITHSLPAYSVVVSRPRQRLCDPSLPCQLWQVVISVGKSIKFSDCQSSHPVKGIFFLVRAKSCISFHGHSCLQKEMCARVIKRDCFVCQSAGQGIAAGNGNCASNQGTRLWTSGQEGEPAP